jgi:DNA-binding transcriptional MerR regulator
VAATGLIRTTEPVRTYARAALEAEGFSREQLRRFVQIGLMPPSCGAGPGAYYTDVHLGILRRIKKARDENRSYADIRDLLDFGGEP